MSLSSLKTNARHINAAHIFCIVLCLALLVQVFSIFTLNTQLHTDFKTRSWPWSRPPFLLHSSTLPQPHHFSCADRTFSFSLNPSIANQSVMSLLRPPVSSNDGHLLGILVPYRNRWNEFMYLRSRLTAFLHEQNIRAFRFFLINQTDTHRFNRGALLNVGFLAAQSYGCDYLALQDVDLIPVHHNISYRFPSPGVYHASSRDVHPRYRYKAFFGGVLLLQTQSYALLGGFENGFWGYGGEDDEFFRRTMIVRNKYKASGNFSVTRPEVAESKEERSRIQYWEHNHPQSVKRDKDKQFMHRERVKSRGPHALKFECEKVYSADAVTSNDTIVLDVQLHCDYEQSPQCSTDWLQSIQTQAANQH